MNQEWITNKARFTYDALNVQRLYQPKFLLHEKFVTLGWKKAHYLFLFYLNVFKYNYINVFCGDFSSVESHLTIKTFFYSMGCMNIYYNFANDIVDYRFSYQLNKTLLLLESIKNILFIALNIRLEAPLINSRFRKNYLNNLGFKAYSFGLSLNNLAYPVVNLGNSMFNFIKFLEGKLLLSTNLLYHDFLNLSYLGNSFYNLSLDIFTGDSLLQRLDGNTYLN